VVEALADRLRVLLRTPLVCILQRQGPDFSLTAVATDSPHTAGAVRAGMTVKV